MVVYNCRVNFTQPKDTRMAKKILMHVGGAVTGELLLSGGGLIYGFNKLKRAGGAAFFPDN